MRAAVLMLMGLTLCVVLSACSGGPRLVKVSGKLTNHDKPYQVVQGEMRPIITFVPMDPKGAYDKPAAEFNTTDGTFIVPGRERRGVPEGKYRIAIQLNPPSPTAEIQRYNQLFTEQSSPIVRDITGPQELTIDLAKEAAAAKK
jgi:hypothetical protein